MEGIAAHLFLSQVAFWTQIYVSGWSGLSSPSASEGSGEGCRREVSQHSNMLAPSCNGFKDVTLRARAQTGLTLPELPGPAWLVGLLHRVPFTNLILDHFSVSGWSGLSSPSASEG